MTIKSNTRQIAGALVFALATVIVAPTPSANAAASGGGFNCTPSATQSGGAVTCTQNGSGGGGSGGGTYVAPDSSWQATKGYPGQGVCTDVNGAASYMSPLYQASTHITWDGSNPWAPQYPHPCINQGIAPTQTLTQVDLETKAKALVIIATPSANFTGNFLTQAPVTFSVATGPNFYTTTVPEVPGATLTASPASDFKWDFGDGNTGTSSPGSTAAAVSSVDHKYTSTTPDATDPTNHTVKVTVSRTWNVYFNQPNADQTTTTFQITVSSTLTPARTIVQVWSAQTEPNN